MRLKPQEGSIDSWKTEVWGVSAGTASLLESSDLGTLFQER